MDALIKKFNFKDQNSVYAVRVPEECKALFQEWSKLTQVVVDKPFPRDLPFLIAFVTEASQIESLAKELSLIDRSHDPVLWFAYPKKSSKKYQTDINRDSGWEPLGKIGLEPVRQIAIDDDWSALRFRPVLNIKSMTRKWALSEEGQERIRKA